VYNASSEVIGVQIISQDITERKRTEEALKESQRRLMTLMGNLPGMAYRCKFDDNWTMEFVSEGCYDLTGYRPDDLINNHTISYSQLVHPEDRLKNWEVVQSEVAENQHFTFTYRIITASGQIKWIWEQGQGVYSADGCLTALEGFIVDISDQKQSEEALNKITIRQDAILASIPDILMEVDTNKVYTWANPAGLQFFGEDVIYPCPCPSLPVRGQVVGTP
jgi:PAS domain S-box-containing protein